MCLLLKVEREYNDVNSCMSCTSINSSMIAVRLGLPKEMLILK